MKEIKLSKGKTTIVDDEDYEYLNQFKWYYNTGYAVRGKKIGGKGIKILMHRLIMGVTDSKVHIDHFNHNKLDNRKENLRIATQQQNQFNKKPKENSSSKYKGVTWCKSRKKWFSMIQINGKQKNLGGFDSEIEAAQAYNLKAKELFGEFAYLNQF
jgi:hypothetical protein